MSRLDTIMGRLAGHAWTIAPALRHRIAPRSAPAADDWAMTIDDPHVGPVEITGRYAEQPSSTLVMLVHGLGGHVDSAYMVEAATAVDRAGLSCLRLNLRGADGTGEDIYHAGLTDDVRAALGHADFERYTERIVIGFSLGGHVALRAALERDEESRPSAVAAICPPLDLAQVQRWLDAPARKIYREYILRELRAMYASVARRGRAPTPVERIGAVRTLLEWDALTVVPRFGFSDPDDYYRTVSVGPRLDDIEVPALLVAGRRDPMIPAHIAEGLLDKPLEGLEVCWLDDGGHVFFPQSVQVAAEGTQKGALIPQVLSWANRALGHSTVGKSK